MRVDINYPKLPLKVWARHDSPDGEWWSNGLWRITKGGDQMWVLRAAGRVIERHEFLSNAMRHAAMLSGASDGQR